MTVSLTHLYNSGFLIECGDVRLIIDFCMPTLDIKTPDGLAVWRALHADGRTIVMATHAHADHFAPIVAQWANEGLCELVLGADIERNLPATYLAPGDSAAVGGATVRAFGSTDQGVSLLIDLPGLRLFHAGDLNDWHWEAESTVDEVRAMHAEFERILETLPDDIDIALFPVDPRMGHDFERGAVRFIEKKRPRAFVPMHFREDAWAAEQFAERSFPATHIIPLTARGQRTTLDIPNNKGGAIHAQISI